MSSGLPTRLGKYEIIREIARSNDIVYEAYDPVMHRRVAVKELAIPGGSTTAQREERLRRFLREARAAGSLVHPNIVTIYEVAQEADRHFIAMEFLDGQNLRNELDTAGFLSPSRAVAIALEVLEGLKFAHSHGVVHRDIKPDNIQILESGQIKLTDFGIARLVFEPNLTMDGQVFGTPSYMSPEQINGQDIDARSDIFSVGVILYEMIAGQKPFPGDSVVSITYSIMNREPTQPAQANHTLWQVIRTALDKSPALRYASAEEMRSALKVAQASLNQVVVDPVIPPPAWQNAATIPGSVIPPPVVAPPPGQTNLHIPYPGSYAPATGQPYLGGQAPITTPYQPYGPAGGQPQMPVGQVPVYYPPPPRRPILKPETKQFFIRFFIAIIVIGTVFGLIIAAIKSLADVVQQTPESPRSVPGGSMMPNDRRMPGSRDSRIPSGGTPGSGAVDVAGQIGEAEAVIRLAMTEDFDVRRQELWMQSTVMFSEAMARTPQASNMIRVSAVNAYFSAATELQAAGQRQRAREALYRARGFAASDEVLNAQISQMLDQLGG